MKAFLYYFALPYGAVWGNLIASFIWVLPIYISHFLLRRVVKEMHTNIKGIHKHLGVKETK